MTSLDPEFASERWRDNADNCTLVPRYWPGPNAFFKFSKFWIAI